jgi:hypothetical protein
MSDFAVEIEGGYATATHHASGHVLNFRSRPSRPISAAARCAKTRRPIGVRTAYGEPRKTPFSRKRRRPV